MRAPPVVAVFLALAGMWCMQFELRAQEHQNAPTEVAAADQNASQFSPSASQVRAALLYGRPLQAELVDDERPTDPWFSFDKVQHITFSFLFTIGWQYSLENKLNWSRNDALPLSIGLALSTGLAKELYDWRLGPRRFFSYRDMIANGVGILAATGLILF